MSPIHNLELLNQEIEDLKTNIALEKEIQEAIRNVNPFNNYIKDKSLDVYKTIGALNRKLRDKIEYRDILIRQVEIYNDNKKLTNNMSTHLKLINDLNDGVIDMDQYLGKLEALTSYEGKDSELSGDTKLFMEKLYQVMLDQSNKIKEKM